MLDCGVGGDDRSSNFLGRVVVGDEIFSEGEREVKSRRLCSRLDRTRPDSANNAG